MRLGAISFSRISSRVYLISGRDSTGKLIKSFAVIFAFAVTRAPRPFFSAERKTIDRVNLEFYRRRFAIGKLARRDLARTADAYTISWIGNVLEYLATGGDQSRWIVMKCLIAWLRGALWRTDLRTIKRPLINIEMAFARSFLFLSSRVRIFLSLFRNAYHLEGIEKELHRFACIERSTTYWRFLQNVVHNRATLLLIYNYKNIKVT